MQTGSRFVRQTYHPKATFLQYPLQCDGKVVLCCVLLCCVVLCSVYKNRNRTCRLMYFLLQNEIRPFVVARWYAE